MEEECDSYLTHVCKYPGGVKDHFENIKTRSFQPTLAFISCRSSNIAILVNAIL